MHCSSAVSITQLQQFVTNRRKERNKGKGVKNQAIRSFFKICIHQENA